MQVGDFCKVVNKELGTFYGRIHSLSAPFVEVHYIDKRFEYARVTVNAKEVTVVK